MVVVSVQHGPHVDTLLAEPSFRKGFIEAYRLPLAKGVASILVDVSTVAVYIGLELFVVMVKAGVDLKCSSLYCCYKPLQNLRPLQSIISI